MLLLATPPPLLLQAGEEGKVSQGPGAVLEYHSGLSVGCSVFATSKVFFSNGQWIWWLPENRKSFPVHLHLQEIMHANWPHLEKAFSPPKHFDQ